MTWVAPSDDLAVRAVMRRAEKLTPEQLRQLHRQVCRLVEPSYREAYRQRWEANYLASRGL